MIVQLSNRAFKFPCGLTCTARIQPEETEEMGRVNALFSAAFLLCWTSQALSDMNGRPQCTVSPSSPVNNSPVTVGVSGKRGWKGSTGPVGSPCPKQSVDNATALVKKVESAFTKCNMFSPNWRQVAHIDMPDPKAWCNASNDKSNWTACKNSTHTFPTGLSYTHVCGRVINYTSEETQGFLTDHNNNNQHADGVLITRGNLKNHLWTYAVSTSEGSSSPTKYGWFYRQVDHTSDSIEVRWCAEESAVFTDLLEIWVL